ncbi:homeodomain super [Friedmanniomyces endolithicus]|uniref:Homeodomain super n=2 Tax=Friedmanniomyces endolithicus TaxID=329885 RepID=A0AAN6FRK3_9PEZI|nr:homeodomain super [Friedmanniomyces endolithicus]KAK0279700.1 homeodomain super [Friedmanniomyces endolithicus]KAK0294826.1 homeodomain super [Friedmanniomyces endolithicus]KAK0320990.1 homeodomain super [Friedmanniomyces endolithicus]KAK0926426.1 homeodomain super [Friedmanniomyces endolithicus]
MYPHKHHSAPQSPPYREGDAQKPSLPPLKMVLGDNLSSPPPTPPILSGPFQPAPREPAFTAATYMPPSLYPHKKPRVSLVSDHTPSYSNSTTCASPGPVRTTLEPRPYESTAHDRLSLSDTRYYEDAHAARRFSVQHATDNNANPSAQHRASYVPRATNHFDRSQQDGFQPYRTPDHTPTSTTHNTEFPAMGSYASSRDSDLQKRRGSQYTTAQEPTTAHDNGSYHESHHHATYPPAVHSRGPQIESYGAHHEDGRMPRPSHLPPPSYHRSPYGSTPPSYFMPSQYEYQQGKARKRSNLPKQSTEIMKTWFDRNITNPYPSEEQKALFSRATGISMTQVSNWFINHRRRCPELRDKREKHRVGGRDGDML